MVIIHTRAAVLNSFWSPHPVRKEKSFLHPLHHLMYCFLYYQRSSHPKKSLLAPPIENHCTRVTTWCTVVSFAPNQRKTFLWWNMFTLARKHNSYTVHVLEVPFMQLQQNGVRRWRVRPPDDKAVSLRSKIAGWQHQTTKSKQHVQTNQV